MDYSEENFRKIVSDLRVAIAAVDVTVFTMLNNTLHIFLVPIDRPPHYINSFGLPGGTIKENTSIDDSVIFYLQERAGLSDIFHEQLYTFGDPQRDKRSRSISVSYLALVSPEQYKKQNKEKGVWVDVNNLPILAYDHSEIIRTAIDRLKGKLIYTNVAMKLLPSEFTLPELQHVYEALLNKEIDKRNFRKKFLSLELVKSTGNSKKTNSRPALTYRFTQDEVVTMPEIWSAL